MQNPVGGMNCSFLEETTDEDMETEEDTDPFPRNLPPRPRSSRKRNKPANFQDQIMMSDVDNLTDLADLTEAGEEIVRLSKKMK